MCLSRLYHTASDLAVYASQAPLRDKPTQDSLPAGGQPLPGRTLTCRVPSERFPLCRLLPTSLPPFPGLAWRTEPGILAVGPTYRHDGRVISADGPINRHDGRRISAVGPINRDDGRVILAVGPINRDDGQGILAVGPVNRDDGRVISAVGPISCHDGRGISAVGPINCHDGRVHRQSGCPSGGCERPPGRGTRPRGS
jgi:hypothetical protein